MHPAKVQHREKGDRKKKSLRFSFLFVQRHSLQNHERGGGRYKGHTKSLVSPLLWFRGSLTATFLFSFWREPLGEIRRCGAKVENCGPLTRAMQKGRRRRREGANLALLAFYAPPPSFHLGKPSLSSGGPRPLDKTSTHAVATASETLWDPLAGKGVEQIFARKKGLFLFLQPCASYLRHFPVL